MPDFRATPFNDLTETHLTSLIAAGMEESRTLDVKHDMYVAGGAGNREFLKDVSAFANTAGGDLLIGMDEQDGIVTAIPGLEGDRDGILLRLEQVATANLTPRVVGLTMRAIPLASGKFVIAVRVPRSWLGPHRVEAEDYRFYYRVERGISRFDVDQLRAAFLAGPEFTRRAREYRAERVARIAAEARPIRLLARANLIVHVLPRDVFSESRISSARLQEEQRNLLPPGAASLRDVRFNLEGLLGYTGATDDQAAAYAHISRFGAYEGVRSNVVRGLQRAPPLPNVSVVDTERCILAGVRNGLGIMASLQREPPFAIFASLVGVEGTRYVYTGDGGFSEAEIRAFDRDVVLPTEEVLSDIPQDDRELVQRLRPLFDEVANAGGWTSSPNVQR